MSLAWPLRALLAWPLPALLAWAAAWAVFLAGVRVAGWPPPLSAALAVLTGCAACMCVSTRWRRVFVAAGFPLSLAATGLAAGWPAWTWLVALAALVFVYPLRTWGDAPVFPTPAGSLRGLSRRVPLRDGARLLDAGCGLGDALRELHREYPRARLTGIEWSRPLRCLCALRARFADVRRADLWQADWSAYDLVYVFQRPETMERIGRKASAQMKAGAWLVSLEFAIPGWAPQATWTAEGGRRLWVYRIP